MSMELAQSKATRQCITEVREKNVDAMEVRQSAALWAFKRRTQLVGLAAAIHFLLGFENADGVGSVAYFRRWRYGDF
ncbi:Hypothetical predicted protein [Olea europaea subsp. europaea]|uniref:Uncharacterized protein n=1 Tax=Olea europaea subsp. europaea TaxID=158383 RepID=A0A8S0RKG1_OLEEU|nr:Hypothetical predicted protein [Olea europaea subsp. europaea]